MLPLDADPVLIEANDIARELRDTRRALLTDCARVFGDARAETLRVRLSGASPERVDKIAATEPAELRLLLTASAELQRRLARLWNNPAHRELMSRALDDHASSLRLALDVHRSLSDEHERNRSAQRITEQAAASGRAMTRVERVRVRELGAESPSPQRWETHVRSASLRDAIVDTLAILRIRQARSELRSGLLLTQQMQAIIREATPALHRGEPLLLIGETGGAKTALAEYLSHQSLGLPSELVSGYGDITSAQVIGSYELRAQAGATESVFVPGPMMRAMTEGHPLILDEINAMPPEFLKRLNRILQLRPGDRFVVQEHAGAPVEIAQGFVILATANEQTPHRYRGLERLSAELINRFGANSYRVHYPDRGLTYTDFPAENALLASAAVADRYGDLPPDLSPSEITRVARAAFISQQVFAGTHGEGFENYVSSERMIDGRPGLEESVLAPRTLVAILQKVAGSAGSVSLDLALRRFVEGVLHREDRHVLSMIIEGQGFRLS